MSFIDLNSNQPTGLQAGDLIIFDRAHFLLRISRGYTPLCPNVDSDSDDKVIIKSLDTQYHTDFLTLCKLMAHAANLKVGKVHARNGDWRVLVEER